MNIRLIDDRITLTVSFPPKLLRAITFVILTSLLGLGTPAALADPSNQSREKQFVENMQRALPGRTLLSPGSLTMVLNQIVSIGLQRQPQCDEFRIESRIIVAPENAFGGFEEVWGVNICNEETKFKIVRTRLGYRKFALHVDFAL